MSTATSSVFSPEQHKQYKRLEMQIAYESERVWNREGNRIGGVKPNRYNNLLTRMKKLLSSLDGDFANHRYMKAELLEPKNKAI